MAESSVIATMSTLLALVIVGGAMVMAPAAEMMRWAARVTVRRR